MEIQDCSFRIRTNDFEVKIVEKQMTGKQTNKKINKQACLHLITEISGPAIFLTWPVISVLLLQLKTVKIRVSPTAIGGEVPYLPLLVGVVLAMVGTTAYISSL